MIFPIVILAGGLATRLRPISESIPKSLIEVAGRPFIFCQLEYLRSQGVRKVILCVGYLGDMIESLVGSGDQFGLEISYSFDGSKLLGTGGAIKKALPLLADEFFVLYGDSFLPINYQAVADDFIACKKQALMTILRNSDRWDTSNVYFENGVLKEYNKEKPSSDMTYIDYGLGVLKSNLFDHYDEGVNFDLSELYRNLSLKSELQGYPVEQRFYEIGSYQGIKETEEYFLNKGK